MRVTIRLDPDVAAAVERMRGDGMATSRAVNDLVRAGMSSRPEKIYVHPRRDLGLLMDVACVADVLEGLDDEDT